MPAPKLVLLTDFSPLSRVAMVFALKMAGPLNAEFTMLNVVRVDGAPKANLKMKQIEKNLIKLAQAEGDLLVKELKKEVKGTYKLQFKAVHAHTVAQMVASYTKKNPTNMVVMGSRGASAFKKARLGGTTVSVIDEVEVPVLAIPDLARFKDLKDIVYATDMKDIQKELKLVVDFAKLFGSTVHVIHVVQPDATDIEEQSGKAESYVKKTGYDKIRFNLIIASDIPEALDRYIQDSGADLLTTFSHHLSLFDKIFARSVTRTLAYQGTVPLLALKRK